MLIIPRTIRSIGNICKNTVHQITRDCKEEKIAIYNKIIKEKSGKYKYIHKVHVDHHSIGATAWLCLD